jgi:hypothetical protein
VVVFTASTRRQSAREAADWDHGAFTKAVVEGLRGRGLAGRKGAVPITITMLDAYISERVKELTHGTQTPTTAKPGTLADFPLTLADGTPAPVGPTLPFDAPTARRRGLEVVALAVGYLTPLSSDLAQAFWLWPHLALAFKVAGQSSTSFSLRLAGGPVGGQLAQHFLAPDGSAVEQASRALAGALFEFGFSLRLVRQRTVRPSFDAGMQLGGAGYAAPLGSTQGAALLAFPLRGRLSLGSSRHAVAVELGIAAHLAPAASYRYTGAGAAFASEGRAWGLQGMLGVSYEYKTKGAK